MAAFVEFPVKGGRRALIDADSIIGILTPSDSLTDEASPEKPIGLVFRNGESLQVWGYSAVEILYLRMRAGSKPVEFFPHTRKDQYIAEAQNALLRHLANKGVDLDALLNDPVETAMYGDDDGA